MAVYPPGDFTDPLYGGSGSGTLNLTAVPPLAYDQHTQTLSIGNASLYSAGVVTTGPQYFAGVKNFQSPPECSTAPSSSIQLVNKGYVDTLAQGITWQTQVLSFWDFANPPSNPQTGDRYIARYTSGGFTIDYIYEYTNPNWVETVPKEGMAVYVIDDLSPKFPNECILFNGTTWVSLGSSLLHQSLIGAGTLTHAVIDSYLNQAVRTTSGVQFQNAVLGTSTYAGIPLNLYSEDGRKQLRIVAAGGN